MQTSELVEVIKNGKILKKNLKAINKDLDFVLDELNILNKQELKKIKFAIYDAENKKIIIKEKILQ